MDGLLYDIEGKEAISCGARRAREVYGFIISIHQIYQP